MDKVFFTGGSGFIGSWFGRMAWLKEQLSVNLDLAPSGAERFTKTVKGDIRKLDDLRQAIDSVRGFIPDVIISLAAAHKDFGITRDEYFDTNAGGIKNICTFANEIGTKKIVYYSSVAVYGYPGKPSNERLPPAPVHDYGASKLRAEEILREWASESNDRCVLIIRPTVVYGEGNMANMYRLIRQIDRGLYFHVGKGNQVKSIAYVENLVQATIWLIERMKPGVAVYNYSDLPHLTNRQIASVIAKALQRSEPLTMPKSILKALAIPFDLAISLTGKDLPISSARVEKFATETWHNADKIRKEGFEPKVDNYEGLQRMVRWYLGMKNEVSLAVR